MMLHPSQFQENEAWIVFQLNGDPIRTNRDGDFNCIALMDAASCCILSNTLISVRSEEPTVKEVKQLFDDAKKRKDILPQTLFVPSGQFATRLPAEAERLGLTVVRISESQLLPFIGEARESYKDYLGNRRVR